MTLKPNFPRIRSPDACSTRAAFARVKGERQLRSYTCGLHRCRRLFVSHRTRVPLVHRNMQGRGRPHGTIVPTDAHKQEVIALFNAATDKQKFVNEHKSTCDMCCHGLSVQRIMDWIARPPKKRGPPVGSTHRQWHFLRR